MHIALARGAIPRGRVHLARLPSSTAVLQGLMTGQLDAASLTLDEVLSARQDSLDLRVVAVLDVSAGADRVLARPGITGPEGLEGRIVAVEKSAVGAVLLAAFLEHHGLSPGDVETVYLPVDRHLEAWDAGTVDVVVSYDPFALALEARGAVSLFDSSQVPGRIVDVLATVHPCDEACVESLALLLAGHFHVLEEILDGDAATLALLARNLGLSPEQIEVLLARVELADRVANRSWVLGRPPRLAASAAALARVMQPAGLLGAAPALEGLIDPRPLRLLDSA
jgi:NitT/TauT family transport system substrate-binding protein